MTKRQAGSIGGRETVRRHGTEHMREIGKRGNVTMRERYQLVVVGQTGYALVERSTGRIVATW